MNDAPDRRHFSPRSAAAARRVALALPVLIAVAGFVPGARAAGPRLVVDRPELDLGQVVRGQTGKAVFELKNAGDAPLHLVDVHPGCSCTVVDVDRTIPPGAVGRLTATLETDGLHGAQARWVEVATDSREDPRVKLVLRAEVVGSVELFPVDRLRITDRGGRRAEATLLLRKEPGEVGAFELTDLRTRHPWLVARAERLTESRQVVGDGPAGSPGDWVLHVTSRGDSPWGWAGSEVIFDTGLPRQPEIRIPVRLERVPPVQLSEDVLELPREGPAERLLLLSVKEGLDPDALRVESSSDSIHLELERAGSRHFKLHVRWDGKGLPKGPIVFVHGTDRYEVPIRPEDHG